MSTTITTTTEIPAQPNGVPPSVATITTVVPIKTTASSTSESSKATTSSSSSSSASSPSASSQAPNFGSANTNAPSLPASPSGIDVGGAVVTTASGTGTTVGKETGAASSSSGSGTNTGLIAGIAVVGALLLIALGALCFLLLKRRRRGSKLSNKASNDYDHHGNEVTELQDRGKQDRHNITSMEVEQSLLANSGYGATIPLDDKQVHAKFSKLNQDIKDWVLTHFRNMNPRVRSTSQDVLRAIQNQPYHKALLSDPRGKYLVIRGIVADALTDAFANGEINGFADVFGMKERFPTNVGAKEKAQWRSNTVALLAKDSGFRGRQERAVETIAERIDYVASSIAGTDHSDARLLGLTNIVESAATLALELSKQRMNFVIMHPDIPHFDPNTMEDVLQESRGEELQDRTVLSVVFPAVVRYGDENGEGFDRRNIISKALVLASGEDNSF